MILVPLWKIGMDHPVLRIRDDLVVTPGNVATELLKHILDRVRSVTGMTPTDVCVTIPAYFENNQRTATLQAVIDAGVPKDHITITNEPTAAALCYGVDNNANNAQHSGIRPRRRYFR